MAVDKMIFYRDNAYVEKPKVMSLSFNKQKFIDNFIVAIQRIFFLMLGLFGLFTVFVIFAMLYMTSPWLCGIVLGILVLGVGIPALMAIERKVKE